MTNPSEAPAPEAADRKARADESVAAKFSPTMNATTSWLGIVTDPPIIALSVAAFTLLLLAAIQSDASPPVIRLLALVTVAPAALALVVVVLLRNARASVVGWLAAQPFPVENMNAVLNGLGDILEIQFSLPSPNDPSAAITQSLNHELDKFFAECFVAKEIPELGLVEVRIGVVDSKRNPARSNHQRFIRVRELVEHVLVPFSKQRPIHWVRIK